MSDKSQREFMCDKCHLFKFIDLPPADGYTNFLLEKCCEKSIERFYDCENCEYRNVRFWCYNHPVGVSASFASRLTDPIDDYYSSRSSLF